MLRRGGVAHEVRPAALADGLPTVCECGQPYLVRYRAIPSPEAKRLLRERRWTMWRYREWLPLVDGEAPTTLGEGGTPLLAVPRLAARYGLPGLRVKDEATNPTGSFKARGLAAAVTRAGYAGARAFVVPTAGNAGVGDGRGEAARLRSEEHTAELQSPDHPVCR